MSEGGAGEDRTEAPSDKRLQQARDTGQVAVSREANVLMVLVATTLLLATNAGSEGRLAARHLAIMFEQAHTLAPAAAFVAAFRLAASLVAPIALTALLAGSLTVLLQTGFLFNSSAVVPNFGRLNPMHGLRRIFGVGSLLEAGKSSAKVAAAGWAAWSALSDELPHLKSAMNWDPATLADRTMRVLLHVVLALLLVQTAIAVLDVLHTRIKHTGTLRMSREESKQEHKESDGDPHVKGRIKKLRIARSKRRMLAAVSQATVVVTNPTHYAVALAYVRGGTGAPKVVAKGVDEMAAKIRAIAAEHRVPVVPNPPLARALYTVELDREIPAEHFKTVAELIAYVWRLRGQR
jgi:flagellar biosynthetic protein FlhB